MIELLANIDTPGNEHIYCAFFEVAQVMKHEYAFLECKTIPLLNQKNTKQHYNMEVNVENLKHLIEKML